MCELYLGCIWYFSISDVLAVKDIEIEDKTEEIVVHVGKR